jgi:hypothetical protein
MLIPVVRSRQDRAALGSLAAVVCCALAAPISPLSARRFTTLHLGIFDPDRGVIPILFPGREMRGNA